MELEIYHNYLCKSFLCGKWIFLAIIQSCDVNNTTSRFRSDDSSSRSSIWKSSSKNISSCVKCLQISTWLIKIIDASTEFVGSSIILANTASLRYCRRNVSWIFALIALLEIFTICQLFKIRMELKKSILNNWNKSF